MRRAPKEPAVLLFKPCVQKKTGRRNSSSESSPASAPRDTRRGPADRIIRKRRHARSGHTAEATRLFAFNNQPLMGQCVQFLTNTGKWKYGRLADHDPVSSRFKIVYVDGRSREVWISTSLVKPVVHQEVPNLGQIVLALRKETRKMVPAVLQSHGRKGLLKVKFYDGDRCQLNFKEIQQLTGVDVKSILVEPDSLNLLQRTPAELSETRECTPAVETSSSVVAEPLFFKPLVKVASKNNSSESGSGQSDDKSLKSSGPRLGKRIRSVKALEDRAAEMSEQKPPASDASSEELPQRVSSSPQSSSVGPAPAVTAADVVEPVVLNVENTPEEQLIESASPIAEESSCLQEAGGGEEASFASDFGSPLAKRAKLQESTSVVIFTPTISSDEMAEEIATGSIGQEPVAEPAAESPIVITRECETAQPESVPDEPENEQNEPVADTAPKEEHVGFPHEEHVTPALQETGADLPQEEQIVQPPPSEVGFSSKDLEATVFISDNESTSTDNPCCCPFAGCCRIFGRVDLLKTHIKYCHVDAGNIEGVDTESEGAKTDSAASNIDESVLDSLSAKNFKLPYVVVNCACGLTHINDNMIQCSSCLCLQHGECVAQPRPFELCDKCLKSRRRRNRENDSRTIEWFGLRSDPSSSNSIVDRLLFTAVEGMEALRQVAAERKRMNARRSWRASDQDTRGANQSTTDCMHSMLSAVCTSDTLERSGPLFQSGGLFDLYRRSAVSPDAERLETQCPITNGYTNGHVGPEQSSDPLSEENRELARVLTRLEDQLQAASATVDQSCSISKQCLKRRIQTLLGRCKL